MRQGEYQRLNHSAAHWSDFCLWQEMQAFGMPYFSVIAGVMKRKA